MCVAQISSVTFTLPLTPGSFSAAGTPFDPTVSYQEDEYVSSLEGYIREITVPAFLSSPLYWHHVLRHVPSDSQMCLDLASDTAGDTPTDMPVRALHEDPGVPAAVAGELRGMYNEMHKAMTGETVADATLDGLF
eukprot:1785208-Rhodomonas_salina.1